MDSKARRNPTVAANCWPGLRLRRCWWSVPKQASTITCVTCCPCFLWLLDSNIDWGQDLLLLKRWLDRHPHVQPIAVAHQFPDWMLDAADIRIPPIPVPAGPPPDGSPPAPPERTGPLPGWYAVFVHQLRARHGRYEYFLRFQPTTTVGYTVTIYHISVEQANRVRRDLGLPDIGANQSHGGHDATTNAETQLCTTLFGRFRGPH